jgi:hypothetical protein
MTYINNTPQTSKLSDSADFTLKVFDAYTNTPISIEGTTYAAMIGFFESRGFEKDAATSIAYIMLKQSTIDQVNPFELIETLKNVSNLQLSAIVTQVLNYNRYKTSSLGVGNAFTVSEEVARNIVA